MHDYHCINTLCPARNTRHRRGSMQGVWISDSGLWRGSFTSIAAGNYFLSIFQYIPTRSPSPWDSALGRVGMREVRLRVEKRQSMICPWCRSAPILPCQRLRLPKASTNRAIRICTTLVPCNENRRRSSLPNCTNVYSSSCWPPFVNGCPGRPLTPTRLPLQWRTHCLGELAISDMSCSGELSLDDGRRKSLR